MRPNTGTDAQLVPDWPCLRSVQAIVLTSGLRYPGTRGAGRHEKAQCTNGNHDTLPCGSEDLGTTVQRLSMAFDAVGHEAMQGRVAAVDALSTCWALDAHANGDALGCVIMHMEPPACIHPGTGNGVP